MIIGLDVGGTHTDAVLVGKEGLIHSVKVATDPDQLLSTIIKALRQLTENQAIGDIERLVLSTTLATNLVVQKKLPPVAVLVSAGPGIDPEYFRIGDHYHVVQGALDHSGREIVKIDEKQIIEIGKQLKKRGISCAAVVSKFSVRNPVHELRIAELLAPYVGHVFMGHVLSGTLNFPRRITTTYLNAAVYPIHCTFFDAVQLSLEKQGLSVPIRVLKPDGGSMNFSSSLDYPAQTILSGPSASVMGAINSAPKDKTCLVLDIGGTTTDMALILNGVPVISTEGIEIGPFKTLIRALMTRSIGIGGDSVIRVLNGKLTIGPDRIGVAMAYGGPVSTPTDALCVLGLTDDGDVQLAKKGLSLLAGEMNMSVEEISESIIDAACQGILRAAGEMVKFLNSRPVYTVHEMFENLQIKPDHILVLGGPASQFAKMLAPLFAGKVETVPHWNVANAIGCALSRVTCEVTVYADTAQKIITAQGEKFKQEITQDITLEDVRQIAFDLVRAKALRRGAIPEYLEMEIIEESQFNMIRGFYTQGKNIRVRAQVKPGLLPNYIGKEATA
jgi:N-methylhydantoinase A/oxoprolinase/acetone carboxylase beta subunit